MASTSPVLANNTRVDQPEDDASIIRLFRLIDNSITDHVLNYYISPNTESEKFLQFGRNKKELEWVLRATPAPLLKEARTQVFVIRAIIGYEIFGEIQDNFFIPPVGGEAAKHQGMNTLPESSVGSRLRFQHVKA